jgi:hypothetical protein
LVDWCCMMCRQSGKTGSITSSLWSCVFGIFDVHWVMPHTVVDLLVGWQHWFSKRSSTVRNLTPLCLMWILWREQNCRTFEDAEVSEFQLKISFIRQLSEWSTVKDFRDSTIIEFNESLPVLFDLLLRLTCVFSYA